MGGGWIRMTEYHTSQNTVTFMDSSDKAPLVGEGSRRRCRPCLWLSLLGLFTVLVLIGGYAMYWSNVVGVRVMSYNTWGMPKKMGSQDKEERMRNIGSMLGQGEGDLNQNGKHYIYLISIQVSTISCCWRSCGCGRTTKQCDRRSALSTP